MHPKIPFEKCRETAVLPRYMHPGDAGMDVYAAVSVTLAPGETKVIPLGFKVAIPEGYEMQVRARSGLSLKTRLRLANGIGTIDAGYRDEVGVIMHNSSVAADPDFVSDILSVDEKHNRPGTYHIEAGLRIAQIVIAPVAQAVWEEVESVAELGLNRGGGMGHSGVK